MNLPDTNVASEQSTLLVFIFILLAKINVTSMLQELSYSAAILLACLTMFITREKYIEEFKKTDIYKYFKNAFKKEK